VGAPATPGVMDHMLEEREREREREIRKPLVYGEKVD
jgi:hypothetical protein